MTKEQNISRRILREKVLQILYAIELSNDDIDTLFRELLSDVNSNEGIEFVKQLTFKTLNNTAEFNSLIEKYATNWDMERIAIIDKILIRIACCELLFYPDIPPKVSMNEAIEIAKRYSTDQSDKFINGILDSIFRDFSKEGKISKKGRGLINNTLPKAE